MTHSFRKFKDMEELETWVKEHSFFIYYHAPMDVHPVTVLIRQYTINNMHPERSRMTIWTKENGCLLLNMLQHLDRFRVCTREE